ncbi:unnamed protein product [Caenorhabditis bovis]|uniref:Domain of unknown function DX domain-containing protein n=1 Tax=Caenorhabditis bovis TaxID=2654633 RepID=A0A8S1EPJ6_9PELO|nr:unnamed protein product [Caenorhabditis bovis]
MANEIRVFLQTKQGQDIIRRQKTAHSLPFEPDAIYFDHFVSVRPTCLVVKKFFLPSEIAYEISWDKIKEINYNPQANEDRTRIKAKGMDVEGRWWAVDALRVYEREFPLYNIRMKADTKPSKIGFSVVDLGKFLTACRPLLNFKYRTSGNLPILSQDRKHNAVYCDFHKDCNGLHEYCLRRNGMLVDTKTKTPTPFTKYGVCVSFPNACKDSQGVFSFAFRSPVTGGECAHPEQCTHPFPGAKQLTLCADAQHELPYIGKLQLEEKNDLIEPIVTRTKCHPLLPIGKANLAFCYERLGRIAKLGRYHYRTKVKVRKTSKKCEINRDCGSPEMVCVTVDSVGRCFHNPFVRFQRSSLTSAFLETACRLLLSDMVGYADSFIGIGDNVFPGNGWVWHSWLS